MASPVGYDEEQNCFVNLACDDQFDDTITQPEDQGPQGSANASLNQREYATGNPLYPQEGQGSITNDIRDSVSDLPGFRAPTLPTNKKYHMFFCHSKADIAWIKTTVDHLESDYGYKCAYDERDFLAGNFVTDNIVGFIKHSVRTVLVLTPNFLASQWCKFERKHVLHSSVYERGSLLLVMLKKCEMPHDLDMYTYIDATSDMRDVWMPKLLNTYLLQGTSHDLANSQAFRKGRIHRNLERLTKLKSVSGCLSQETLSEPDVPLSVISQDLQISEEDLSGELDKTESAFSCGRWLNALLTILIVCIFLSAGILTFALWEVIKTLTSSYQLETKNPEYVYALYSLPFISILGVDVLMVACFIKLRRNRLRSSITEINKTLLRHNILLGGDTRISLSRCNKLSLKIILWYYDPRVCKEKLVQFLNSSRRPRNLGRHDETNEDVVDKLMIQYSEEYTRMTLQNKLKGRSNHVITGMCLCQFIETKTTPKDSDVLT